MVGIREIFVDRDWKVEWSWFWTAVQRETKKKTTEAAARYRTPKQKQKQNYQSGVEPPHSKTHQPEAQARKKKIPKRQRVAALQNKTKPKQKSC